MITILQRQMLQWITALQKVESQCLYTKRHRYDSFAPVRSNVAAQWLVDGVRLCYLLRSSTQTMVSGTTFGICRVPSCLLKNPYISMIGGYLQVGDRHLLIIPGNQNLTSYRITVETPEQRSVSSG